MKCILSQSAKNFEEFIEQLKLKRILCFIAAFVLLIASIIVFNVQGRETNIQGYRLGILVGMCVAFFAIGVKLSFSLKNKKKLKNSFIDEYDERNVMIVLKVSRLLFVIIILSLALSILISAMFSYIISAILCYILCAILVLYSALYFYYKKYR